MREEESIVWMMCHHLKAACALMNVCLNNELVDEKQLMNHLIEQAKEADDVWEEQMWTIFLRKINRPDNVVLFSPDIRGPDV